MNVLKRILLLLAVFYFSIPCCKAQSDSTGNTSTKDPLKAKIGALPSVFYSPETRLGFGGFIYAYFNTNKSNLINKKSNAQSYLSYTINKQFSFENDYQIWLKSNKYYLTGGLDYSRFPEFFYGISNDAKESDRVMVSFDVIKVRSKNLIQLDRNLYGGFYYQYETLYNLDMKLKDPMASMCEVVKGGEGYTASGIGPILIYDKRDNPLNPAQGSYIESSFQYFDKTIGSPYKFNSFVFDVRKYYTIYKKLISNSNLYVNLNKGNVPYRMLATIGGARFLRGYYRGRFRDNNMVVLQQEFRMPIYKWLGLAVFGGVGSVANRVNDFRKNEIHYDYGCGLRIRVNKKENTNIRIDYGITKDSQGIYLIFAEAF